MSRHIGNILSPIKNPMITLDRVSKMIESLKLSLEQIENSDAVKQESYQREVDELNRFLISTNRKLDEEVGLNNELMKENSLLRSRINKMLLIDKENKVKMEKLQRKNKYLEGKRSIQSKKFKRWIIKKTKGRTPLQFKKPDTIKKGRVKK